MAMPELGLLVGAIIVLLILSKLFRISMSFVWNGILGAIGLYLYNMVAGFLGFGHIPLSIINILIVGFFGIPGLIALVIWHFISKGSL